MYITDIEVNDGQFLRVYPSQKLHILFYSNHLVIWHSCPDITHDKVNKGLNFAIFVFDQVDISQGISLHETAQFVYSNGVANLVRLTRYPVY